MNSQPRRHATRWIFAGTALWGVLLVSCVMVDRPTFAPPKIAGAKFAGTNECQQCHAQINGSFHDATHARLMAPGENERVPKTGPDRMLVFGLG